METLQYILLGVLGIVFYSLWNAKDYMKADKWNNSIFFNDHFNAWIWSFIFIVAVAVTLQIEPKAGDILKTFTGIDLLNTPTGYISLGLVLCGLVKK